MTTPTLYEFAGGAPALLALAEAQYRRCLADPLLSEVFGTSADPEHVIRLAAWLGEVFGGPATYSERYGGHEAMISHHMGSPFTEGQRVRFVEAMLEAADEVGLPANPVFRERLREYFDWGSRLAVAYSQPGAVLPRGEPAPKWGWEGGPTASPGAASGVAASGPAASVAAAEVPSAASGAPSFERDIKPLFRDLDVRSMAFVFDLHRYEDVAAHAPAILERLAAATMPCDGPWPAEQVARFQAWISAGRPR